MVRGANFTFPRCPYWETIFLTRPNPATSSPNSTVAAILNIEQKNPSVQRTRMKDPSSSPDSDCGLFPLLATSYLEPSFNVLGCRHGHDDPLPCLPSQVPWKGWHGSRKGRILPDLVTSFEQRIIQPVDASGIGIIGQEMSVALHCGRGNPDVVDGDGSVGLP